MPLRKALCIDAGGIRAIVAARFLHYFEQVTDQPISDTFDLLCGTSTGGLLALGLALPHPADGPAKPRYRALDLLQLFLKHGARYFPNNLHNRGDKVGALDIFYEDKGVSHAKERILRDLLGEAPLSTARTNLLLPSYDMQRRKTFFFKYFSDFDAEGLLDLPLWLVGHCISATPTIFDPVPVDMPRGERRLVDGCIFAANPTLCALAEMRMRYPNDDLLIVSVGTGDSRRAIRTDTVRDIREFAWAQPLLRASMDGQAEAVHHQLNLLMQPDRNYFRFQTRLAVAATDAIDDASPTNLAALDRMGQTLIEEKRPQLDTLLRVLDLADRD